jgi:L-Ala-D/L-Glu epimerase
MVLKPSREMRSIAPAGFALDEPLLVESIAGRALSVPLLEPFVIATGRVDATRAVEIEARVTWRGRSAVGLGEVACLPPVTREDQPDVLAAIGALAGRRLEGPVGTLDAIVPALGPVARAGLQTAVLDAMGRIAGVPCRALLAEATYGSPVSALETDVTIAIAPPGHMAELARRWVARGFRALKVKVGKGVDADLEALLAVAAAAPGARLRVDANAGYAAHEAIALGNECERRGLPVECWEQPCAEGDLDGMAAVTSALSAPVIADESVKRVEDVRRIAEGRCARGVNLKLAKSGGLLEALATGRAARKAGLQVMVGGMVETRLGMTAAAHVACALGGADYVDLDTAWLLADDPYEGGYRASGPRYDMPPDAGLGVARRARATR